MSNATPVKRGLTLAWSIGLGLLLVGISTVLLLPATKSARIRFDEIQKASPEEIESIDGDRDATGAHTEDPSTPEPSP